MDYLKLVKTLKITNPLAFRSFCDLVYDFHETSLQITKSNNLITIELPSDDFFKSIYGPIKISFKDSIKPYNITDIEPKSYLEDCHKSFPISYKGVMIPNTNKDKFKVDLALRMRG